MAELNQTATTAPAPALMPLDQDAFLSNMQTTVIGNVVSITKYEIEGGANGGSIWVSKPTSGRNPNVLGEELIKINIPFAMFDQQRQKLEAKEITIPGYFEILAEIDMGGQNRAKLTALSIRKYVPPTASAPANTTTTGPAPTTANTGTANDPTKTNR